MKPFKIFLLLPSIFVILFLESCSSGYDKFEYYVDNAKDITSFCLLYEDEIPMEVLKMKKLEVLSIPYGTISKIPPDLFKLTNLKYIDLRFNNLKVIPEEIVRLQNLETLYLSGNPIPEQIINKIRKSIPKVDVVFTNYNFGEFKYIPKVLNGRDELDIRKNLEELSAGKISSCLKIGKIYEQNEDYERAILYYLLPKSIDSNSIENLKQSFEVVQLYENIALNIIPKLSYYNSMDRMKDQLDILTIANAYSKYFCESGLEQSCKANNYLEKKTLALKDDIRAETQYQNEQVRLQQQLENDIFNTIIASTTNEENQNINSLIMALNSGEITNISEALQMFAKGFTHNNLANQNKNSSQQNVQTQQSQSNSKCVSCENDPQYVKYKQDAANGGMKASYCATVKLYECYLRNGCYKEAGAPTELTKAQLEQGLKDALQSAKSLDNNNQGCN